MKNFWSNTKGASAVEFALVAPLSLLILVGIIGYGMLFSVHLSLQHLLAETTRASIPGLTSEERETLAAEYFGGHIRRYPLLDADEARLLVADDGRFTRIEIHYDFSRHPAYTFEGLLPLPGADVTYVQNIRNGGLS